MQRDGTKRFTLYSYVDAEPFIDVDLMDYMDDVERMRRALYGKRIYQTSTGRIPKDCTE